MQNMIAHNKHLLKQLTTAYNVTLDYKAVESGNLDTYNFYIEHFKAYTVDRLDNVYAKVIKSIQAQIYELEGLGIQATSLKIRIILRKRAKLSSIQYLINKA